MARVKTAIITRKKHNKILKRAKGYYGAKHYRFRTAKQQIMKSGNSGHSTGAHLHFEVRVAPYNYNTCRVNPTNYM